MKKVLIFGATGLLGSATKEIFSLYGYDVFCPGREDFSPYNYESIEKTIQSFRPDFTINCLVKISVEECENDWQDAYNINGNFPFYVAGCLHQLRLNNFIQISSSDVFSNSQSFIKESDIPTPINNYGHSKYYGEYCTQDLCLNKNINYNILRIGWMYGRGKDNFVNKVKRTLLNNQTIEIIKDQYNIPVWNEDVAYSLFKIVKGGKLNNKILHFSSYPPEIVSKVNIANLIADNLKKDRKLIIPRESKEIFNVKRPQNVCLRQSYELEGRYWKESLVAYLNKYD